MNKKKYIKPEIVIEELEFETHMMADSFVLNEEGGKEESLSAGRRGTWGDLWHVEED